MSRGTYLYWSTCKFQILKCPQTEGELEIYNSKTNNISNFSLNPKPISMGHISFPGTVKEMCFGIAIEMNPCTNACFLNKMTKLRSKPWRAVSTYYRKRQTEDHS